MVGYWRPSGEFVVFTAKAVIMATGGVGKSWLYTSNSWESTGDGHAMSLWAGADLIDMEAVQFHPTGMVWPLSVRGILVTEGVRGDGGVLRNSEGNRFMFDYIPPMFAAETADSEDEADKWYDDHSAGRRPPELLPRDEVARSINSEVKAGRGSPHGGVFLDIATRRTAEDIRRRLPSMYHQFKELAGVDITAEAMEVGPTCHYIMGGVRVDADSAATTVAGLFAAGEVAGGMHGANRLGGNSLSDLLVFGRGPASAPPSSPPDRTGPVSVDEGQIEAAIDGRRGSVRERGGREPLRRPSRPPDDHAEPGRDHPDRRRARGGAGQARRARGAGQAGVGERRASLQPRLEPDHRPPRHAHRVAEHHTRSDQPQGEPGRAHPGRLPEAGPRDGNGQLRRAHPEGRRPTTVPAAPPRSSASPSPPSPSR